MHFKMNQCVPSGDPNKLTFFAQSNSFNTDVPSLDYEVAELTWENGHLAAYGLGAPRVSNNKPSAWGKPRATDTLESIVDQATALPPTKSDANNKLVPWLDTSRRRAVSAAASAAMDALVPCNNSVGIHDSRENSTRVPGMGTCMVGSCSGAAPACGGGCWARGGKSYASASQSLSQSGGRDDSQQVTLDSGEREFGGGGMTSTSIWSPENTSSGEDYAKTSGDDHDVVFHSRSQREAGERGNKKLGINGKSSIIAKPKTRAAAIHNQSERRRRDKINQRMKTLQKLVPNSSKTDKASMLDEVIEYLKQLEAQVQMSRMNMPLQLPLPLASMNMNMMMPLPMHLQQQHHLQMSMMASMGMGGMGMGVMGVMDINSVARATGMQPIMPTTAPFIPMAPPWDVQHPPLTPDFLSNFFDSQSHPQPQPTTMDGYSRLAALYHQFHQSSAGCGPKIN